MDRHQRQSAIEEWLVNGEIILKEHEKLKRVIEDPQQSAHVAFFKLYYHIDKITIDEVKKYSDLLNKKRADISSTSKLKGAISTFVAQTLDLFAYDISQKKENVDFMKKEGTFPVELSAKQAEENKRKQEERRKLEEQKRREEEQKRREEEAERILEEERERKKNDEFIDSRFEDMCDVLIRKLYRQREEYASKILTKRKKCLWIIVFVILLVIFILLGFLWKKVTVVNDDYNTFISQTWTDLSGKECNRRLVQIDSLQEDFIFYLLKKDEMLNKREFIVERKELLNKTLIDNLEKCFTGKVGRRTIDKYARQKNVKEINKIYRYIEELKHVEKSTNRKKADEYQKELNQIAEKYGIKYDATKKIYVVGSKKKNNTTSKTTAKTSSTSVLDTQSATKIHDGHGFVDLGLSVKWAACNIGATRPEEYGDYFAWGEVKSKSVYDNKTYKYNKTTLDAQYDVAIVNWGGSWRMPTDVEMTELLEQCKWTWTTQNRVYGYKVIGKNGNSIFLPAAGYRYGSNLIATGSLSYYWSSSIHVNKHSIYVLTFNSSKVFSTYYDRIYGFSVRPVCK